MRTSAFGKLPAWAQEMLATARVGHLGLLDEDDRPRVLPITFALHEGDFYSAVDRKPKRGEPARVRYLRRRPEVSLTVDHYDDDWSALAWVQALCAVEVEDPADAPGGFAALLAKYAPYREQPPPGPLFRVRPMRFLYWRAMEQLRQ